MNRLYENIVAFHETVKLSLIFWMYLIRGAIIFSLYPCSLAMVECFNQRRLQEEYSFSEAYKKYSQNMWNKLISCYLCVFLSIMYFMLFIMRDQQSPYTVVLSFLVLYSLFFGIGIMVFGLHFTVIKEMEFKKAMTHAFICGVKYLYITVAIILICVLVFTISAKNLIILICIAPSLFYFLSREVIMFLFHHTLYPVTIE